MASHSAQKNRGKQPLIAAGSGGLSGGTRFNRLRDQE
jgi:hypothetical protein